MPGQTSNNVAPEASRKRARRTLIDEGHESEETIETRQASSGLRHDGRKRVRVSDAVSSKGNGRSVIRDATPVSYRSSEDEDDMDTALEEPGSPAKTQYEMLRDDGFKFTKFEEEDDRRATQRILSRNIPVGETDRAAENGILESITCINFMCHTRLHCELGPFLNFIVGENGSGKSAILTAITLCLGGKASSTNRGGSLKSFVKEGQERAMLCIKIKNQGPDAYKPDLYGESIVIERHFSKTVNSSGFKVRSATNHIISQKRQEVDEIVEYFVLQVDNPLCILSQDNARQFLNTSTKAQKYKFFLEGVQLQQLDTDYRLMAESLDQMEAKLPDQKDRQKAAQEEWAKAKRLVEAMEDNHQLRAKLRSLGNQLAWIQVRDQRRELATREEAIQQVEAEIASAEHLVEEKAQVFQITNEKVRIAEESFKVAQEEQAEAQNRVDIAKEEHQSRLAEREHLYNDERDARGKATRAREELATTHASIAEEEERLQAANGDALTKKQQELEAAKGEVDTIRKDLDECRKREAELTTQCQSTQKAAAAAAGAVTRKREDVAEVESRMRNLEQNRGSKYEAYEAGVPNLIRMIEQQNGFEQKPIGPLGAYVHLTQPRWSAILEQTLGGTLNAFLVSSYRDQKLLAQLMARANVHRCPIIIIRANRNPLNTEGREPDESFDTIMRVLTFDNPRVRDQLIIGHQIEKVILIPERKQATEVMMPQNGPPPRNVSACLSFHDTKYGEGIRLTASESAPVRPNPRQKTRMHTDLSSQMEHEKEALQHVEDELRQLDGEKRRADQEHQRCQSELKQTKSTKKMLDVNLRKAEVVVRNVEAELDQFEGVSGRLQGLKDMLEDVKGRVDHFANQYADLTVKRDEKAQELKDAAERLKTEKDQLSEAEQRARKAEDKVTRLKETREFALKDKNEAIAAVQEARDRDLPRAVAKRDRQKTVVEDYIKEASKVCDEIELPETETEENVSKQYKMMKDRIQKQADKHGMTEDEAHAFFRKAEKEYRQTKKLLQSSQALQQRIKESLKIRARKWSSFRRLISSLARSNFVRLLHERGFTGRLLLDHEKKLLDLRVEPADGSRAGRSTKTLSGGEKSFSSICLLLSIWEAIGSPLRCLDEFDVFMDNVNRSISTGMLISAARQSVNKQYIFITPNAIEGRANLDSDVKIIRLTDPRQRTLADH